MALSGLLGSSLDATTNAAPNGITTPNPYPSPYVDYRTVSTAWTTQAKKALFPRGVYHGGGFAKLPISFIPSNGAAVTFTGTIWIYNQLAAKWTLVSDLAAVNYTGFVTDYIPIETLDPIYIQLSSISVGTLTIYFDNGIAEAK